MKKPSQFPPLLKQMLGFYRYGRIPLLLWLLSCGITLHFSAIFSPGDWMRGHNGTDFREVQVWSGVSLWFFLMLVATPLPSQLLGGLTSLEFLFTRAIDRAGWLRAERGAVIILAIGPLAINLVLSPWASKLAFEPAEPGSAAAQVQAKYVNAFPGSQRTIVEPGHTEHLVIRHGTEMFAAWLVWAGLVGTFLVAGYFTLAFTAWQRTGWHHSRSRWRPWLGGIMVNAPAISVILVFSFCLLSRVNIYEEGFLLFARHPLLMGLALLALILIVQPLSERNIKKLEFEFF